MFKKYFKRLVLAAISITVLGTGGYLFISGHFTKIEDGHKVTVNAGNKIGEIKQENKKTYVNGDGNIQNTKGTMINDISAGNDVNIIISAPNSDKNKKDEKINTVESTEPLAGEQVIEEELQEIPLYKQAHIDCYKQDNIYYETDDNAIGFRFRYGDDLPEQTEERLYIKSNYIVYELGKNVMCIAGELGARISDDRVNLGIKAYDADNGNMLWQSEKLNKAGAEDLHPFKFDTKGAHRIKICFLSYSPVRKAKGRIFIQNLRAIADCAH